MKINKIDKPLAWLSRGQSDSIKINKIRKESGEMTAENEEIQKLSDHITKAYIQHNCKIWSKWAISKTDTNYQSLIRIR